MKSLILIAVLAALTACNDAASIQNEAVLYQDEAVLYQEETILSQEEDSVYQKGSIARLGEILFHDELYTAEAIPNVVQVRDVVFRGNATTRLSGSRIYNPPVVPGHTHHGALGTNHITIRLTSPPGVGLNCRVQLYGRYTDSV